MAILLSSPETPMWTQGSKSQVLKGTPERLGKHSEKILKKTASPWSCSEVETDPKTGRRKVWQS